MEKKHTDLKWKAVMHTTTFTGDYTSSVYITNGKSILYLESDEAQANAEFIVTAVNHHDELVEVLKVVLDITKAYSSSSVAIKHLYNITEEALSKLPQ